MKATNLDKMSCSRFSVPMRNREQVMIPICVTEAYRHLPYCKGMAIADHKNPYITGKSVDSLEIQRKQLLIGAVDEKGMLQGNMSLAFEHSRNRLLVHSIGTSPWNDYWGREMRGSEYDPERAIKRIGSILMATVVMLALRIEPEEGKGFPLIVLHGADRSSGFYEGIGMSTKGREHAKIAEFVFHKGPALDFAQNIVSQYGLTS